MRFKLISTDGRHAFDLEGDLPLVVGRAPSSDIPVIDPTISRRHAAIECEEDRVVVRDLGSSNGTFLNGTRIETAALNLGDIVSFGKVGFKLQQVTMPVAVPVTTPRAAPASTGTSSTIVRQLPVRTPSTSIAGIQGPLTASTERTEQQPLAPSDKIRQKLATLLEVSKGLGRATDIDSLLDKIVEYAYQILEVDRVAILLTDDQGELVPKIARDRRGGDTARA